jgi:2-keto-4-pentenoate hydratase/2-oxohepta-3-ene-1,7-dioic acid hydratase in catechol pathway
VVVDEGAIDVHDASSGAFGPSVQDLYDDFDRFLAAARSFDVALARPYDTADLASPVPLPRQVFAIGLNYRSHAEETGMAIPEVPAAFTKFPSSLGGPNDPVVIEGDTVDYEAELVVVMGATADRVTPEGAWQCVAGISIGQDLSDRTLQFAAAGQFSLGKSHRGFGPIGPWVVTVDEFDDPDDLELGCRLNGDVVQQERTTDLIFSVPSLISELSAVLPLWPGDVIFTGTPAGVGLVRQPPVFLQPGDVLETWIEGIGTLITTLVGPVAEEDRHAS